MIVKVRQNSQLHTLIAFTKLAVLLATSFALCTKCRFATGLSVLLDARRHALHRAEVCLATTVAADSTCKTENKSLCLILHIIFSKQVTICIYTCPISGNPQSCMQRSKINNAGFPMMYETCS